MCGVTRVKTVPRQFRRHGRAGGECSNGLPGVEDSTGSICCAAACSACGGRTCGITGEGIGPSNCCISPIFEAAEFCDETGAAPCILGGESCCLGDEQSRNSWLVISSYLKVESGSDQGCVRKGFSKLWPTALPSSFSSQCSC